MNARRPARFALIAPLLSITLITCGKQEETIVPVIPPPPPAVRQLAEAGDPSAQFAMAEYHVSDEDPTVMLRWLRASACQGYPLAQVSLGVLYDAGDSVPQDRISAYIWFSEAAQGEGDAVEMAADLNAAMADDERAFAQGLIRQGRSALIDCRLR
ncbi:MAG TPA: hypothetical protein P5102_16570 [Candidatus Competibacteraceae bacterium]|nr:hypothetical protein [Candidatus Competibacteraceae bacterium]HRZ07724.1 hypothetical protein [Candidatus Competibacteraceae bacterium]